MPWSCGEGLMRGFRFPVNLDSYGFDGRGEERDQSGAAIAFQNLRLRLRPVVSVVPDFEV
jgi:hypothetical protein